MITLQIKEFKVSEVIKAIAENGFDHLRGRWYLPSYGEGRLTGGCVLMQGGMNLSVIATNGEYPNPWETDPDVVVPEGLTDQYGNPITTPSAAIDYFNLYQQLSMLDVDPKSRWYTGEKAADTIIYWNDQVSDDGSYYLKTYKDVEKMVRSILNPHRYKTVRLIVVDYGSWNLKKAS